MNPKTTEAPALTGVHHLELPVTDLRRSQPGYATRLDPGRARAAAGLDHFAIGVPDEHAVRPPAARTEEP